MAEFVAVANVDDVPPGTATVVTVEGIEVALVNVDGSLYAVDNECTHLGGYLGEGEINLDWSDWAIECPLHASVFDVRTGEVMNPPATRASADLSGRSRRLGHQGFGRLRPHGGRRRETAQRRFVGMSCRRPASTRTSPSSSRKARRRTSSERFAATSSWAS